VARDWRDDRIAKQAVTIAEQAATIVELRAMFASLLARVETLPPAPATSADPAPRVSVQDVHSSLWP